MAASISALKDQFYVMNTWVRTSQWTVCIAKSSIIVNLSGHAV